MKNQLTVINQDAKQVLTKTKGLLDITNKILQKKKENEIIKQTQEIISNPKVWMDPDTSLTWQVDVNGQVYTWEEAFEYAKDLNKEKYGGYDDWRVPNLDELKSILTSKSNKCSNGKDKYIKKSFMESQNNSCSCWSSTTYADGTNYAWVVDFYNCLDYWLGKTLYNYVRCVRAGQ